MESLLFCRPISVQVKGAVLERLTHVLATDPTNCKAAFVQTGGLQLVQELAEEPDSPFVAAVGKITALYPQELVNRFSPAYNRALMEQLSAPPGQVAPQMVVSDAVMAPAPTPASAAGPSAPPVPALSPRPAAYVAISSNSPPVPAPAAVPCHVPNCVPAPERSAHQPAQVSPQRASPPAPGPVALPSTTEPSPSPGAHLLELDVHDDVISAGEEKMEVSVVLAAEEAELSCGTDADVDSMADLN